MENYVLIASYICFLLYIVFLLIFYLYESTSAPKEALQSEKHKVNDTPKESLFDRNYKITKERFLRVQTTLERLCCEHVNDNESAIEFRELKHKGRKLYHRYEELDRAYDKCKDAAQELNSANEVLNLCQERMWDFRDTYSVHDDNFTSAKTLFHEIDMESIQNDINRAYHIKNERERRYNSLFYEYDILYVSFSEALTSMEKDMERLPCIDNKSITNKCPNIITQIES